MIGWDNLCQSSWTCAIFGLVIIKFLVSKALTYSSFQHANIFVHENFWLGSYYNFLNLEIIPISLKSLPNTLVGLHLGILRYISTYMGRPRVVAKGCEHGTIWAHLDVLATNSLHHTQELCFEPLYMARPLWNGSWSSSRPLYTISTLLCWMNQRYAIILFLPHWYCNLGRWLTLIDG